MVEQQVADHEDALALGRQVHEVLRVGDAQRQRLLDEHVLAGQEQGARERVMMDGGGRDHGRLHFGIGRHLLDTRRGSGLRILRGGALEPVGVAVAQAREPGPGQGGEIADEVGPPIPRSDHRDADLLRHFPSTSFRVPRR